MLLIPQLKNYQEVLCKYLPSYWCVLDCFAVAAFGVAPITSLLPGAEMWVGNQVVLWYFCCCFPLFLSPEFYCCVFVVVSWLFPFLALLLSENQVEFLWGRYGRFWGVAGRGPSKIALVNCGTVGRMLHTTGHHCSSYKEGKENRCALISSCSFDIWGNGTRYWCDWSTNSDEGVSQ